MLRKLLPMLVLSLLTMASGQEAKSPQGSARRSGRLETVHMPSPENKLLSLIAESRTGSRWFRPATEIRNAPSLAVVLNCGMGSSFLNGTPEHVWDGTAGVCDVTTGFYCRPDL